MGTYLSRPSQDACLLRSGCLQTSYATTRRMYTAENNGRRSFMVFVGFLADVLFRASAPKPSLRECRSPTVSGWTVKTVSHRSYFATTPPSQACLNQRLVYLRPARTGGGKSNGLHRLSQARGDRGTGHDRHNHPNIGSPIPALQRSPSSSPSTLPLLAQHARLKRPTRPLPSS